MARRWTLTALGVACAPWLIFLLDDPTVRRLAEEDGPVEYLGALSWLLAAVACGRAFFRSSSGISLGFLRTRRNVWLLLLGLLFAFAGGEELSWGQRLIGFSTPQAVKVANQQGEFNLHNLAAFHMLEQDGCKKSGVSRFLSMERLFALFWLGFCLLLPIGAQRWRALRREVDRLGVPVVPVGLGLAFVVNYGIHKVLEAAQAAKPHLAWSNVEVKETVFALLFLLVALRFMRLYGGAQQAAGGCEGQARVAAGQRPC